MKTRASLFMGAVCVLASLGQAQVSGGGATNFLPRFTSATSLGNSTIMQTGGRTGVRTTAPVATFDIVGLDSTGAPAAPVILSVRGGKGAGPQGAGGNVQMQSGIGAIGIGAPGAGATFLMTGGTGGVCLIAASVRCAESRSGNGGSIVIQPGAGGGSGVNTLAGSAGSLNLAPTAGRVGIRTSSPTATFTVGAGASTLADSWTTRSSRRFKTDIHPLLGAMEKVMHLEGVTYTVKADGRHEIGVIAEDVQRVVPEIVSSDPETKQVEGVDYSRLTALLIEAIKTQQAEIQELRAQVARLGSK